MTHTAQMLITELESFRVHLPMVLRHIATKMIDKAAIPYLEDPALITAAPLLLAACKKCLRFHKGLVGKHPVAKVLRKELEVAIEAAKGVK